MKSTRERVNRHAELSKARAAGMAAATAGRARVFRDRTRDDDGGKSEIREGLAVAVEEEEEEEEKYADWDF
jgi:hypothetical protein